MGIYLNPGNVNYSDTLKSKIYVDKTMMLDVLNDFIEQGNKYICVSRPRRFGKTIAQNMIAAYYSKGCDSHDLFKDLKITQVPGYEKNMNRYNVIQIDLNGQYESAERKEKFLRYLLEDIKEEMIEEFKDIHFNERDTLAGMMLKVFKKRHETFVILIDEYDVLVREQVPDSLFKEYLALLNGLFKNNTLRPAISLAYITGILPVIRDKVQSKLNNFQEYTILDGMELAEYIGFTTPEVQAICDEYGVDFAECRRWYDGYSQHGFEIYNPESVVMCVKTGRFGNYWGRTSTYNVVSDRISANFDGMKDDVIRMMAGEKIPVDVEHYENTMDHFKSKDDAFTYLIHTGYLAYDLEDGTCRIPNNEIRKEWKRALEDDSDYSVTNRIIRDSQKLLQETWNGNCEAVAKALDESHINVASNRSYNNEDVLQSAVYLAYIYALNDYTRIKEMTAGKGFADLTYIPVKNGKHPAMIIELKKNHSTETALDQIKEKRYFDSLSHYQGDLLFVGINYDGETKTHDCRIEKFMK